MRITIKLRSGEIMTRVLRANRTVIGRSESADVVVNDESLSRKHCLIELVDGNFFITDLGSSNGVYIDGQRLTPHERSPFNVFFQLQISTLECTLEDETISSSSVATNQDLSNLSIEASKDTKRAKKKFSEQTISTAKNKVAGRSKTSSLLGLILPALVLIGSVAYFFMSSKDKPQDKISTSSATRPAPQPITKKVLADEFKYNSEYQDYNQLKACVGNETFCQSMQLDPNQHEGLVFAEQGLEVIVFINPYRKRDELIFQGLAGSKDQVDLIAIQMILKSDLLNQFVVGKISQIHLVINALDGVAQKVYRFHPNKFVAAKAPRSNMLISVKNAFITKDTDKFWALINPYISSKELNQ